MKPPTFSLSNPPNTPAPSAYAGGAGVFGLFGVALPHGKKDVFRCGTSFFFVLSTIFLLFFLFLKEIPFLTG